MTEYSKFTLTAVIGLSLLTPVDVQAIPPRQHSVTGTVERIDPAARSIVVSLGRQETSSAFVWSDTTRFYLAGAPVGVETATVGESVRLIFRREAGQRVIRKLSITREANGCCCGGAGSKHGKNSI